MHKFELSASQVGFPIDSRPVGPCLVLVYEIPDKKHGTRPTEFEGCELTRRALFLRNLSWPWLLCLVSSDVRRGPDCTAGGRQAPQSKIQEATTSHRGEGRGDVPLSIHCPLFQTAGNTFLLDNTPSDFPIISVGDANLLLSSLDS